MGCEVSLQLDVLRWSFGFDVEVDDGTKTRLLRSMHTRGFLPDSSKAQPHHGLYLRGGTESNVTYSQLLQRGNIPSGKLRQGERGGLLQD